MFSIANLIFLCPLESLVGPDSQGLEVIPENVGTNAETQ